MAERTLSERELNRALLARQLLLERARLPIPGALERVGGLQTQYAPSGYVGLWSRLEGFERGQLTRALERRTVVQATLMRVTIHLVSARDYWPFVEAVRIARRVYWLQLVRRAVVTQPVEETAERLRALLADGPRRRAELVKLLGVDPTGWNAAGLWVDLVRVPPSGTWEQRRADLYGLAEDWLDPSSVTEEEGIDLLVRRYLAGFGPATRKDVASFTGLGPPAIAAAL
ncbi:MAG: DNA glycosylase AlkZ-like family protein, partial [Actinomycetota bacterium]